MRRRLAVVYVSLLVVACLGLALPLCGAIAAGNTADMIMDRSNDTVRFASMAGPALESGETEALRSELDAYDSLYEIRAAVVDQNGDIVVSSRPDFATDNPETAELVRAGLAGNRAGADDVRWPWDERPLIVVEPIARSGEVIGAVVTVSPTGALRQATIGQWGIISGGVLVILASGIAAAGPLTRWVLRPVRDLDQATRSISEGDLTTRVRVESGPPELRDLGESFNRMAETITTLLQRQRAFVSYAGHQVRNPLAALRLRVDGLAAHLDDSGADDHRLALDEADRLTRICDTLLSLAGSGSAPQPPVPVDVRAIAELRVAAWAPVAGRAGATLACCGTSSAAAYCPDGTLDQVLDVLIDNALKFGGAGVRIAVHVRPPADGRVVVHVVDDGPGLTEEQLADAAQPFWRSTDSSGADGQGLGLSIVSTLLQAHGGDLRLTRADPHGIDARVRVPAAEGAGEPHTSDDQSSA
ncbi:signal transduction histidine kinase [Lipingzhangella halophila]|uniref:histidine kinase n=1 Tax=Lipingzhangella halophila TaxID=1783352 RepID=A0A7W7RDL4_9ACTN|nr:HAMP domain-containing sensor histidine kinase [Lipingzhangella halophila]MBB4929693.1 signal transduction histidine kinase [Lipingzhangella halophila]